VAFPSNWAYLMLIAAVIAMLVTACLAPTGGPSAVTIVNDMSTPVRIRLCSSNNCAGFYSPQRTLDPQQRWSVNISARGVPNVYLVESVAGTRYGCLPFVSPSPRREIAVYVSENVHCRRNLNEREFWPARWRSSS
jgi:hypothetical protein